MNAKTLKKLEFEKVVGQVAQLAVTELGKQQLLQLEVKKTYEEVNILQEETDDGRKLLRLKGGDRKSVV